MWSPKETGEKSPVFEAGEIAGPCSPVTPTDPKESAEKSPVRDSKIDGHTNPMVSTDQKESAKKLTVTHAGDIASDTY